MEKTTCLLFILLTLFTIFQQYATTTMLGKISSSLQMAGKLLGLDKATSVAELVSEAFGKTNKKGDEGDGQQNIFSGFLRILGFDAKKIGAIAVNAIILVAQLISTSLTPSNPSIEHLRQSVPRGDPFDWMMNSSYVSDLMTYITDRELPDEVIRYIRERNLDEDTGCLQQLICKSSPFVWGMQKALTGKQSRGRNVFFAYFPDLKEVEEYADKCERKYPYCFFLG